MSFTAEELKERQQYLGASEAASALGLSTFFTPLQLYKSKIGEAEPIEETLPMMVGTALEPVVIRMFEKETGMAVTNQQLKVVDPTWSRRRCTLDGIASDGGIIQAKASGMWGWWGDTEDAIPESIIFQTQHEMACTGKSHAYVPVILGQRTFKYYTIQRDEELIDLLTKAEQDFMARVDARDPPPPVDMDDLKILYPIDTGISVTCTDAVYEAAVNLAKVKAQLKGLGEQEDQLAFAVKDFMKDAAILKARSGEVLYTWKSNAERSMDVTTFRKDHPALAEQYSPEKTVRKLLCKIK